MTARLHARLLRCVVAASLLSSAARTATAQTPDVGGTRPELRLDLRPLDAVEAGVGFAVPTSLYLRVGALASGGVVRDGDSTRPTARIEAFLRLPLDPLFERRWAPYVGGGAALACTAERRCLPLLTLRIGLEGPRGSGGWTPAFEVGVGGGVRVAVVLRRANGPGR